jgi:hypothetical protein
LSNREKESTVKVNTRLERIKQKKKTEKISKKRRKAIGVG